MLTSTKKYCRVFTSIFPASTANRCLLQQTSVRHTPFHENRREFNDGLIEHGLGAGEWPYIPFPSSVYAVSSPVITATPEVKKSHPKIVHEMLSFIHKTAKQGSAVVQLLLRRMYSGGVAVPQDSCQTKLGRREATIQSEVFQRFSARMDVSVKIFLTTQREFSFVYRVRSPEKIFQGF